MWALRFLEGKFQQFRLNDFYIVVLLPPSNKKMGLISFVDIVHCKGFS